MIRRWVVSMIFPPLMRAARVLIWLGRFDAADRALRVAERVSRLAAVLVVLALPALAQVPASKPFDLASMWAPWTGQVANVCGSGKNCTVQTLTTTSTGAAIRLPYGATVGWPISTSPTAAITAPSASVLQLSASGGYINLNGALRKTAGGGASYVTIEDTDGIGSTGVAFASFTACSGSMTSALQYDTTNGVWRLCDGSTWRPMGQVLTTPTINSGFGTSPSITGRAGAFQVTVGTGGVATTGVVRLSFDAVNGWNCTCTNFTSNNIRVCVQCSDDTNPNGDITFCSRDYTGATAAFVAGDLLKMTCEPF